MNFLIFISTIDWFDYTGYLRELGARPLNLVFFVLPILLLSKNNIKSKHVSVILILLFLPVFISSIGYLINYNSIYDFSYYRDKVDQFLFQIIMYLVFLINVFTIYTFCNKKHLLNILNYFRICILLNFLFILLEFFNIFPNLIDLFRVYQTIERPSGLHTEPSYASFSLIFFSLPLYIYGKKYDKVYLILSFIYILIFNAKTGMFVFILSLFLYFIIINRKYFFIIFVLLTLPVLLLLFDFNINDNLSIIMRLGSAHLSFNVIVEYFHTLFGIGFGQFNFLYLKEFAPDYLFLSFEGREYLSGMNKSRAPTFNLYTRLLVEVGIIGFLFYLLALYLIVKRLLFYNSNLSRILLLCLFMCLSFLLTQDGYSFPPFFITLGLILRYINVKS